MKRFIQIIILTTISLAPTSCDFILDKENFIDINKTLNPEAIEINFENQDTMQLRLIDTAIYFNIKPKKYKILEINCYRNNEHIQSFSSGLKHKIQIYSQWIDEGLNTYRIEVITNSNTGSIADLTQNEGYAFNNECYVLKFPNDNPTMSLKSEVIDGVYKLSWNKYPYSDFKQYVLNGPNNFIFKTNDINQLSYPDSSVIEKIGHYYHTLDVDVEKEIKYRKIQGHVSKEFPLPKLKVDKTGPLSAIISWDKTQFKHGFKEYELVFPGGVIGQDTFKTRTTKSIHNIDSTSISITNVPFGSSTGLELSFIPHNMDSYYKDKYTIRGYIPTGITFKNKYNSPYNFHLNKNKKLYNLDGNPLKEYDEHLDKYSTVKKFKYEVKLNTKSANENSIWINSKDSIYSSDEHFNLGKSYSIKSIWKNIYGESSTKTGFWRYNSDEVGNLYFVDHDSLYKYNLNQGEVVTSLKIVNPYHSCDVSINGDYIIRRWKLYKLINNEYQIINTDLGSISFHPTKNILISEKEGKYFFYDLDTFTIVDRLDINGKVISVSNDWSKLLIYDESNNQIRVFSVDEKKILFSFNSNEYKGDGYYLIYDNYIYYKNTKLKYQ